MRLPHKGIRDLADHRIFRKIDRKKNAFYLYHFTISPSSAAPALPSCLDFSNLPASLEVEDLGFGGKIDQMVRSVKQHVGEEPRLVNLTSLGAGDSDPDLFLLEKGRGRKLEVYFVLQSPGLRDSSSPYGHQMDCVPIMESGVHSIFIGQDREVDCYSQSHVNRAILIQQGLIHPTTVFPCQTDGKVSDRLARKFKIKGLFLVQDLVELWQTFNLEMDFHL